MTVKHWGGEAGIVQFNAHIPCSGVWDTMISYMALISTLGTMCRIVLANPVPNGIKKKVSPQVEVIIVDNKRWNKIAENQIKFIDVAKEWMHGCVMENVQKIKIKIGKYLDWPYQEHICTESSSDKWPIIDSNKSEPYPGTIPIVKYWGGDECDLFGIDFEAEDERL